MHDVPNVRSLGLVVSFCVMYSVLVARPVFPGENSEVLLDFSSEEPEAQFETTDSTFEFVEREGNRRLLLKTGSDNSWPGITITPPETFWDVYGSARLAVDVRNAGDETVQVGFRVDSPEASPDTFLLQNQKELAPGESDVIDVSFTYVPEVEQDVPEIIGMRGVPPFARSYENHVDPSRIEQIIVFVSRPEREHRIEIDRIRAVGDVDPPEYEDPPDNWIPFIDRFGQYMHRDWPGKVHSVEEMKEQKQAETKELERHAGPEARNKWGGWTDGPTFDATGTFGVRQHNGKWWLVDPDGHLFWSHGPDVVNFSSATPITDRRSYFAYLPEEDSPLAQHYGESNWAPHGYYRDRGTFETFDFFGANLQRKYGSDWKTAFAERTHRRLRSWGMNTIANWSEENIYNMEETPYVVTVSSGGPRIEGSEGYWSKFPDPFHPEFRTSVREHLQWNKKAATDPWCIGIFVDNELTWGSKTSLAEAALKSPESQPAREMCIEFLKDRYGSLEALGNAWGHSFDSWAAVKPIDGDGERPAAYTGDLSELTTKIAETYFRVCREEIQRIASGKLYLGCRFMDGVHSWAIRAAAAYSDVLSFNLYRRSVADFQLPDGIDKPVIIGEFHFGALDRGLFHTGLQGADNQDHRAQLYESYVRGALRHPTFVGAHWFQYMDQATTGRGDGENYQIGLIDITDTPYPETIDAVRDVTYEMYEYRSNAGSD